MGSVYAVYSETGGATKTTTAVSLAVCSALQGHRTLLIDMDPRGAATKWCDVTPSEAWRHTGAILGAGPEDDVTGWADELAIASSWRQVAGELSIVPSSRQLSNRESNTGDHSEVRLKLALQGSAYEVVVLDLPNRQGGILVQNALTAANHIIYAGKLDEDGLDGVEGAMRSVHRFRAARQAIDAPVEIRDAGIVVGAVRDVVMSRDSRRSLTELDEAYGTAVLRPFIPERVVVKEARAARDYFGWYDGGAAVHAAYMSITEQVLT